MRQLHTFVPKIVSTSLYQNREFNQTSLDPEKVEIE